MACLACLALVAAHAFAGHDATGPIFFTDEVGYLSNAQLMAGVGEPRDLSFSSYYIGWSLLLVPLWWIKVDPAFVYQGAAALSVLCGVGVAVPLTFVARRFGLAGPWAVAVAAVVAVAPARVIPSNFALAENFLALLIATTVVLGWRFADRQDHRRAALLGAAAAAVFVTHGRAVPILVATLAWFGYLLTMRRSRPALTGVLVAGFVAVPLFLLYRRVADQMYAPEMDRESRGIDRLMDVDPRALVLTATGQAWYVTVSWLLLALVGTVIVVSLAYRELRRREPGAACWMTLSAVGIVVISVTWISTVVARGDTRYDIYSYGRYLDPYFCVLAVIGFAALARRRDESAVRAAATMAAVASVAFLGVVVPRVPSGPGTWWGPNSVAGLLQWNWPGITAASSPPWYPATVAALVVVGLVLVRGRVVRFVTLGAVGVFMVASAFLAQVNTLDPFYAAWYDSFTLRDVVSQFPDESVSFDTAGTTQEEGAGDTVSRNAYQFWLAPREVGVFDSATSRPETTLVISRKDWDRADVWGARKIADDTGLFNNALWVMPGPLQEALAAAGQLDDGP